MYIGTPHGAYRVIRVLAEDDRIFSCLAVRKEQGREVDYLMQEFREADTARELFCRLVEPEKGENPGFIVFVKDGSLWMVSRYYTGMSFAKRAVQTDILEEKLQLWDGVLREILFRDLPVCLQYEAAAPSNLIADDGLAVHANYRISDAKKLREGLFSEVQRRLSESFAVLFACEGKHKDEAAAAYRRQLQEAEFADGRSVYQGFRELERTLWEQAPEGEPKQEEILIRWWKKAFAHADGAVRYGYWLIVAALWGLFLAVCVRPVTAPAQRNLISRIGTVGIRGYGQSEDEKEAESENNETETAPGEESKTGEETPGEESEAGEDAPGEESETGEDAPGIETETGTETEAETGSGHGGPEMG